MLATILVLLAVGGVAAGCLYTPDANGHVTVPDGITSIGDADFEDCDTMVSIGLPAGLFHAIYQRREKILAGDETTLRTFSFVLGGYKSTHWYWEVSGSAWLLVASVGPGLDLLTDPCDR